MSEKLLSPEWITDKYILIMLGIFPLWTGLHGYGNVTFSKFLFFAVATGIWILWTGTAAVHSRQRPEITKCGFAFMVLAGAAIVSALFSPYGTDVIIGAGRYDGLVSLLLYILIFVGVSSYGSFKPRYIWALAFSITVCCVVSLFQLLGHNPLGLFPSDYTYFDKGIKYSAEFLGNIGNVDVFAALLCVGIPVIFGAFICGYVKHGAWLILPGALAVFIAVESGVASAKLGLGVSFIVGFFVLLRKSRLKNMAVSLAVIVLTVALAGNVNFAAEGVSFGKTDEPASDGSGTAYEISQIFHGHIEDSYGSGRIGIWRQLLEVYPQRPILGGGPGTVANRVSIEYSRFVPQTGKTLRTSVDNAHNEYLGYLMDEGAVGLCAYVAAVLTTFILWLRRRKTGFAALGCGLMGYWVQSFFGIGLSLVLPVIWLIWGLMWTEVKNENS